MEVQQQQRVSGDGGRRTILQPTANQDQGVANTYVLRGLNRDGDTFWYTGKAGDGWISQDQALAFTYGTLHLARNKAMGFNRYCPLHGLWFIPMEVVYA